MAEAEDIGVPSPRTAHTPTPWRVHGRCIVVGQDRDSRQTIARITDNEQSGYDCPSPAVADVNAALIVRAVNAHAGLVAALETMLRSADASWEASDAGHDWREACEQARAALKGRRERGDGEE